MRLFLLACSCFYLALTGCTTQSTWNQAKPSEQAAAYAQRGWGYLEAGQANRALQNFRQALDLRPQLQEALHGTAVAMHQQGENQLAEKYFQQALQISTTLTATRNDYAAFLFSQKRYAEAQKQLEKASQDIYYPDRYQIFTNLGYVAMQLEQTSAAITNFEQALYLQPSFISPYRELLFLYAQKQLWQQAEQQWLTLKSAQVTEKDILQQALLVVEQTGNFAEIDYLNQLLQQH